MTWFYLFLIAVAAYFLWGRHVARRRRERLETQQDDRPREFGRRKEPVAPPERRVTETVSVVLRRQVPPRDEAPRSWLGGLPMLPESTPWPRSVSAEYPQRGERPLHFVAQIACADLPAELWGGLGPREGWLLFFIDPNQGVPEESDAFRAIHTDALGIERAGPADLGPVHDGVYTGPRYDYCAPGEVPAVWRRWPVDLVTVPNTIRQVGRQRRVAAPEDFAAQLYPGQPIAAEGRWGSEPEPFTWRGALYVLNGLQRSYAAKMPEFRVPDRVIESMRQPGLRETVLRVLDEQEQHWMERNRAFLEGPEPAEEKERARHAAQRAYAKERRRQRAEIAALLDAHPTPESLLDYFQRTEAERREWHAAARGWIAAERDAVLQHALDTPIDPAAWAAIQDRLRQHSYAAWTYDQVEWQGTRSFGLREIVSRMDFKHRPGVGELIADYYADPRLRSLIPPDLIAAFEPHWRRLEDNMPHRMGGYHDGVQSDPEPGPAKALLLFQIVSDPAMNWCWGDVGAYYVFIAPDDLERGDFTGATMTLECH